MQMNNKTIKNEKKCKVFKIVYTSLYKFRSIKNLLLAFRTTFRSCHLVESLRTTSPKSSPFCILPPQLATLFHTQKQHIEKHHPFIHSCVGPPAKKRKHCCYENKIVTLKMQRALGLSLMRERVVYLANQQKVYFQSFLFEQVL